MSMGKDVDKNEILQTSSQQKMINSKEIEILRVKKDRKLSFHQHINRIYKKAGQKTKCIIENFPIP